jgi:protein SCO1
MGGGAEGSDLAGMTMSEDDLHRKSPAPAGTKILWALLALVLGGVLFTWFGTSVLWRDLVPRKKQVADLPSYGQVGDFELTDQLGRTVRRNDFEGRPWVADFVFTHCAGPCPLMTAQMARLADSLGTASPVRFASFSVDPERDTPEVLKRYAENYGADHTRWHFLTGDRKEIAALARNSFHMAVDEPRARSASEAPDETATHVAAESAAADNVAALPDSAVVYDIPHSIRFVLVDGKGEIRGYYDGTDEASLQELHRDLALLVSSGT